VAVCRLNPFSLEETQQYVQHRLECAGRKNASIFDKPALSLIHQRTAGIPRLINRLCDAAMISAFGRGETTIGTDTVEEIEVPEMTMQQLNTTATPAEPSPAKVVSVAAMTEQIERMLAEGETLAARAEERLRRAVVSVRPDYHEEDVDVEAVPIEHSLPGQTNSGTPAGKSPEEPAPSIQAGPSAVEGQVASLLASVTGQIEEHKAAAIREFEISIRSILKQCTQELDARQQRSEASDRSSTAACQEIRSELGAAEANTQRLAAVNQRARQSIEELTALLQQVEGSESQSEERIRALSSEGQHAESAIANARTLLADLTAAAHTGDANAARLVSVNQCSKETMGQLFDIIQQAQAANKELGAGLEFSKLAGTSTDQRATRAEKIVALLNATMQAAEEKLSSTATLAAELTEVERHAEQLASINETALTTLQRLSGGVETAGDTLNRIAEQIPALASSATQTMEATNAAAEMHSRIEAVVRAGQEQLSGAAKAAADIKESTEKAQRLVFLQQSGTESGRRLAENIRQANEATSGIEARIARMETAAGTAQLETTRASTVAEELKVAAETAELKSGQLSSMLQAVGQSASRAMDACRDANAAADQLNVTHASIVQESERLGKIREEAHQAAERLGESGTQVNATIQEVEAMLQQVAALSTTAEHRQATLDEVTHRADSAASALSHLIAEANACAGRLATEPARAREILDELAEVDRQAVEHCADLTEQTQRSIHAAKASRSYVQAAEQVHNALGMAADSANATLNRLHTSATDATDAVKKLTEQREACRASMARHQQMNDTNRQLAAELQSQAQQAETTIERMQKSAGDCEHVAESLASIQESAAHQAKSLELRIQEADSRNSALDASQEALAEFIAHAEAISRQLDQVQARADSISNHVRASLDHPEQVVAEAKAQAVRLQDVCQAVRKVFASVSQATLKANKDMERFGSMRQSAEEGTRMLAAETARATDSLRAWVTEAIRTQSRLAGTLSQCPTISQTHPVDSLKKLGQIGESLGLGADHDHRAADALESAIVKPRMISQATDDSRPPSRTQEIERLLEETKKFAKPLR
jgi:chromosome segregation ATPase